jgi:hypothetical protein
MGVKEEKKTGMSINSKITRWKAAIDNKITAPFSSLKDVDGLVKHVTVANLRIAKQSHEVHLHMMIVYEILSNLLLVVTNMLQVGTVRQL